MVLLKLHLLLDHYRKGIISLVKVLDKVYMWSCKNQSSHTQQREREGERGRERGRGREREGERERDFRPLEILSAPY